MLGPPWAYTADVPIAANDAARSGGVDRLGLADARRDEAAFIGEGDELRAVVAVELGEDTSDVRFGGEGADDEGPAISALLRPAATSCRISRSRSVSSANAQAAFGGVGRAARSAISRLVTEGASMASPAATIRIA
jgi:hypothetical protein